MTKKKQRAVPKAVRDFIDKVGLEYTGEGPMTQAVADEIAENITATLQAGHNNAKKLALLHPGKPDEEIQKMCFEQPQKMHADVESFRSDVSGFCIAKAVLTASRRTMFGHEINMVAGEEYCMTPGIYRSLNNGMRAVAPSDRKFSEVYRPYNGEDLSMKTLFVWREGGVGDLIFIRPLLCHLKKIYPTCKIIFATRSHLHCMVRLWGDCIDEYEPVPFKMESTIDAADYHLTYMGVIERIAAAESMDVHDLFAEYMGIDADTVNWIQPLPTTSPNLWFETSPPKYAVMQATSSSPIRTPHTRILVRAINTITATGLPVVIADMKQRARGVDDVISLCANPELCINFARFSENIQDVVKLISRSKLVVAPDSCMVHIAAAQKVPCVGIYGPFAAQTRTRRYPLCSTIEPPVSDCCEAGGRYCFRHNQSQCEYFEQCWDNLDVDKLCELITEKLEAKNAKK
jgi:ADP-heptose:LPS heptosyltransferase